MRYIDVFKTGYRAYPLLSSTSYRDLKKPKYRSLKDVLLDALGVSSPTARTEAEKNILDFGLYVEDMVKDVILKNKRIIADAQDQFIYGHLSCHIDFLTQEDNGLVLYEVKTMTGDDFDKVEDMLNFWLYQVAHQVFILRKFYNDKIKEVKIIVYHKEKGDNKEIIKGNFESFDKDKIEIYDMTDNINEYIEKNYYEFNEINRQLNVTHRIAQGYGIEVAKEYLLSVFEAIRNGNIQSGVRSLVDSGLKQLEAEQLLEKYISLSLQKDIIDRQLKELKELLTSNLKEGTYMHDIHKIIVTGKQKRRIFDSRKFKNDNPTLYEKYLKEVEVQPSVKLIKPRKIKNNG